MSDKKCEIFYWEKEECVKLKVVLEEFNVGKFWKDSFIQGKIVEVFDMSQGFVSFYFNGYNVFNVRFVLYVVL